jgi:hypothetical protein
MAGFLQTVEDAHPTFVAVGVSAHAGWAAAWLRADYWRVGGNDGWRWYLARSSGPDAQFRARVAHDDVMAAYALDK